MTLDMEGKIAVVAAASSGLGKATAKKLAERGAGVVICSRDRNRIESAAEELRLATGRAVVPVVADVTRPEQIQKVADEAMSFGGRIDMLVTNAGGPPLGKFEHFDDEAWLSAHETNFMSVVRFIRAVLPAMKKQQSGSIVNIISSSVKQPLPGLILSNAYRSAVVGLAKTLAHELAPYGIRVNNAAPGRFETDRVRSMDQKRAEKEGTDIESVIRSSISSIPLGRSGHPEEFANAVSFLLSAEASFITGTTLLVDGGSVKAVT